MGDFEINKGTLIKYKGEGGDVVIPHGITRIGDSAFCDCESLTSVVIPEGVACIEDCAFAFCTSLRSVSLPQGLITISELAFSDC